MLHHFRNCNSKAAYKYHEKRIKGCLCALRVIILHHNLITSINGIYILINKSECVSVCLSVCMYFICMYFKKKLYILLVSASLLFFLIIGTIETETFLW
jgi:hypothetical protein